MTRYGKLQKKGAMQHSEDRAVLEKPAKRTHRNYRTQRATREGVGHGDRQEVAPCQRGHVIKILCQNKYINLWKNFG